MITVSDRDIIMYLVKKAKELGYKDYRYYLMEIFHKQWNDDDVIFELYDSYIDACAKKSPKAFSEGTWGKNDTFEDYLAEAEKVIEMRLDQLRKERKQKPESFTDPNIQQLSEQGNLIIEGVGEQPETILYEFYEEILRRTKEAIERWKKGNRKVPRVASWMKGGSHE